MGTFIYLILDGLIRLAEFFIIVTAIASWLVAFDVVNIRNPTVNAILRAMDAIVSPILAPFRRFMPNLGGIDITPVIALIVLEAARVALLPWLFGFVRPYLG